MHLVADTQVDIEKQPPVHGLAGWVLRTLRGLRAQQSRREARRHMRVVETLSLGGKNKLVLVSCGGERFLVGAGPETVGTITRVKPEPAGLAQVRER